MRIIKAALVFLSLALSAVLPAQAKEILPGPFAFEVLDVIDGDTFRTKVKIWLGQTVTVKVRLKGVDTPEMNGKCAAEKKLAQQAKKFAADWLATHSAQLVNVHYGTYAGRVLATAQNSKGETLSDALLAAELARPYRGRKASWCD